MKKYILLLTVLYLAFTSAYSQWNSFNISGTIHLHTADTINGNVGIGTAAGVAPKDKLHVEGATAGINKIDLG